MSESVVAEAIALAGGPKALGLKIGLSWRAIYKWIEVGRIPVDRVPAVSAASGIPRYRLRPDRPDLFPVPKKRAQRA